MGYETTLLIGKRSLHTDEDGAAYFNIAATLDLCKTGSCALSKLVSHHKGPPYCYWYFDGNTPEREDRYGEKPIPLPIKQVAEAAAKDAATEDYRRFNWAAALLNAMADDPEDFEVLFYGH